MPLFFPTFCLRPLRPLLVGAAVLLLGLSACGPLVDLGGSTPPANIYRLEPLSDRVAEPPAAEWRIRIAPPTAGSALDTNRIAVATGPLEIQYYAEARWADRVPEMVQSVLVESFEAGAGAVALTSDSVVSAAPFLLEADIRTFQADVGGDGPPQVTLRIAFRLLRSGQNEFVASTTVNATAEAASRQAPDLVQAFNTTMQMVLRDAVNWTVERVRAAGPA